MINTRKLYLELLLSFKKTNSFFGEKSTYTTLLLFAIISVFKLRNYYLIKSKQNCWFILIYCSIYINIILILIYNSYIQNLRNNHNWTHNCMNI